jgi:hypothetical protein
MMLYVFKLCINNNMQEYDFVYTDNFDSNQLPIITNPKISNINQNACPICLNSGNMIYRIDPGNLFVRLECGNLVCSKCWNSWKINGYKCPVCNIRSHKEQEIILEKNEFSDLYSDNHNKYTDEVQITILLCESGRINNNFIPDPKKVQIEDIEVELKIQKFLKNELKHNIIVTQIDSGEIDAFNIQKMLNKLTETENLINNLRNKLFELDPNKIENEINNDNDNDNHNHNHNIIQTQINELDKIKNNNPSILQGRNLDSFKWQLNRLQEAKEKQEKDYIEKQFDKMQDMLVQEIYENKTET